MEHKEKQAAEARQLEEEGPRAPHMLHAVCLVEKTKGSPWWEIQTLEQLGLTKRYRMVPLANTPKINKKLKLIQHLVEIQPLQLPHGLPEHESDYKHSFITTD